MNFRYASRYSPFASLPFVFRLAILWTLFYVLLTPIIQPRSTKALTALALSIPSTGVISWVLEKKRMRYGAEDVIRTGVIIGDLVAVLALAYFVQGTHGVLALAAATFVAAAFGFLAFTLKSFGKDAAYSLSFALFLIAEYFAWLLELDAIFLAFIAGVFLSQFLEIRIQRSARPIRMISEPLIFLIAPAVIPILPEGAVLGTLLAFISVLLGSIILTLVTALMGIKPSAAAKISFVSSHLGGMSLMMAFLVQNDLASSAILFAVIAASIFAKLMEESQKFMALVSSKLVPSALRDLRNVKFEIPVVPTHLRRALGFLLLFAALTYATYRFAPLLKPWDKYMKAIAFICLLPVGYGLFRELSAFLENLYLSILLPGKKRILAKALARFFVRTALGLSIFLITAVYLADSWGKVGFGSTAALFILGSSALFLLLTFRAWIRLYKAILEGRI